MFLEGGYGIGTPSGSMHRLPSMRDVSYSCGSCGYSLNLSSSHRNTTNIGTKYRKAIKKGIVSFYSIDESRHKTKLQCRKCGNFVGSAYEEVSPLPSSSMGSDVSDSSSIGNSKKYNIKISALQPTSEESGTALIVR
ncbi:hypothetical protein M5K25_011675 [Dendrobium thyrsiflorum]|uniref:Uncharacterized protein n=1 Tax=Dendrobium thyrsiflorum TaxID=117978 RepID=A0ABD0VAZ6_DENTH